MMTILLINTALAWEVQTTEGGAEYHWADMPLDYVWVPDGAPDLEELQRAIDGAFTTWSEVPSAHISVEPVETDATGEVALDEDGFVGRTGPIAHPQPKTTFRCIHSGGEEASTQ